VSKVFQGVAKAGGSVADTTHCARLWSHEVLRVFYDRLVDDTDRAWLGRQVVELNERHFKEKATRVLGLGLDNAKADDANLIACLRDLMFADFMVSRSRSLALSLYMYILINMCLTCSLCARPPPSVI
jgi:dynein heavy chain